MSIVAVGVATWTCVCSQHRTHDSPLVILENMAQVVFRRQAVVAAEGAEWLLSFLPHQQPCPLYQSLSVAVGT